MRINGKFAPGFPHRQTHGLCRTRAYSIWADMKKRCSNPKHAFWMYYGGKGISVCQKWQRFEGFFEDMGQPPEGLSLDRIDGSLGYYPENCRWATAQEQSRNRSNRRVVRALGNELSVVEWAEKLGINESTIRARLNKGWSDHDAVTKALKVVKPFSEWDRK